MSETRSNHEDQEYREESDDPSRHRRPHGGRPSPARRPPRPNRRGPHRVQRLPRRAARTPRRPSGRRLQLARPMVPGITVDKIKVHSPAMEGNLAGEPVDRDVIVTLPPSYGKDKNRRYPVLYFLHGFAQKRAEHVRLHARAREPRTPGPRRASNSSS